MWNDLRQPYRDDHAWLKDAVEQRPSIVRNRRNALTSDTPRLPGRRLPTVDDTNPALPMKRTIPQFPEFKVLKVMQDVYHQQ